MDGWDALEFLKGLVQKRENPEGSIVERYMVYQTMEYINIYLPKFVTNIHVDCIWDPNSVNNFEREYLIGKGRSSKVRGDYKMLLYLFNS